MASLLEKWITMFDPITCVELRVLGPGGKPYIDLENLYSHEFKEHGVYFKVPRLFSAPSKTTVAISIGAAVIASVASHLVIKFIDDVFSISKSQPNTEITINIHNGDKHILIEGDKTEIINKINNFREKGQE